MKQTLNTKPAGNVWVKPASDSKGEYYEVVDDSGQWWGFATTLDDARNIRLKLLARCQS